MSSKSPVQGSAGQADHADSAQKSDEKKQVLQAAWHAVGLHPWVQSPLIICCRSVADQGRDNLASEVRSQAQLLSASIEQQKACQFALHGGHLKVCQSGLAEGARVQASREARVTKLDWVQSFEVKQQVRS